MNKFFEKHDLIKLAGILVLVTALLTWVIPYGYYGNGEMVIENINRLGLVDFMQYGLLGMYYFTILVTFLFVLGGFYQVLSKTDGYKALILKTSEKLKNHKIIVTTAVSFVFAALASISKEYFPLLVLIPFVISIFNKMNVNKISTFSATFGSLLVGIIGNIYGDYIAGNINATLSTDTSTYLLVKIILFVVVFVLLNLFNILRLRKLNKTTSTESYDKFEITSNSNTKKTKMWPYIVVMSLMFLTVLLAYLPWADWNITVFTEATEWVNSLSLFEVPIINYIFGKFTEFGSWDIYTIQFVMIFAAVVINCIERKSVDETIESFGEGFKKISPVVGILLLVYLVLEISAMCPIVPVVVNTIANWTKSFNVFTASLSAFITSTFSVEMRYVMDLAGSYYASEFATNTNVLAIIFQAMYGFAQFFVPSSAILMMGLTLLNISYKDWMKHIWKFLLAVLFVILLIVIIL